MSRYQNPYFDKLNNLLKAEGPGRPVMVLDLDRLDANLNHWLQHKRGKTFRIVAKSLPSVPLLKYIRETTGDKELMTFHQPFMNLLALELPDFNQLAGKPMPVRALATFYDGLQKSMASFRPEVQMQWLVDTPLRVQQYLAFAKERNFSLNLNIEVDAGLHRGGVADKVTFREMLTIIAASEGRLLFSGLMGYEAHIPAAPPVLSTLTRARDSFLKVYTGYVEMMREEFPLLFRENLCWNGGGSKTYMLYDEQTYPNDISIGSGLVQPTDFDVSTLSHHQPAIFIAAPVLKKLKGTTIPFLEFAAPMLSRLKKSWNTTYFTYAGKWMALPVDPPDLVPNSLYPRSTNQDIMNCPRSNGPEVDDHLFFRPTQSEFMMLLFGPLWLIRGGKTEGQWPVFPIDPGF